MRKEIKGKFSSETEDGKNRSCGLARTVRASSLTPTTSMATMNETTAKNAKSIDDLIESLNSTTETPKSSSRKKYWKFAIHSHVKPQSSLIDHHLRNIHRKNLQQPKN